MRLVLFAAMSLMSHFAMAQDSAPAPTGTTSGGAEDAPAENPPATPEAPSDRDGLLGPFRIGPTISVGIPFIMNTSLEVLYKDTFSGAVSFGGKDIATGDVELGISNFDVRGRWHPWQGSFFIGAIYGNQKLTAKMEQDLEAEVGGTTEKVPTTIDLEVKTTYITPHLGWFAMWDSGFTLGFELGYQMPLASDANLDIDIDADPAAEAEAKDTDDFKKNKKDVEDAAQAFGEKAIPYINLLRIGWLF
jgi:hypothetical protein